MLEPSVSPQLQEVLYRALETDPKNRYATAHECAADLEHLDQVGVEDRAELRDWRKRKAHPPLMIAVYVTLIVIPIAFLIAMVILSRHN